MSTPGLELWSAFGVPGLADSRAQPRGLAALQPIKTGTPDSPTRVSQQEYSRTDDEKQLQRSRSRIERLDLLRSLTISRSRSVSACSTCLRTHARASIVVSTTVLLLPEFPQTSLRMTRWSSCSTTFRSLFVHHVCGPYFRRGQHVAGDTATAPLRGCRIVELFDVSLLAAPAGALLAIVAAVRFRSGWSLLLPSSGA